MEYPAGWTVHTPSGETNCCTKHAMQLKALMSLMGAHVNTHVAPDGAECENCKNEANPYRVKR